MFFEIISLFLNDILAFDWPADSFAVLLLIPLELSHFRSFWPVPGVVVRWQSWEKP